MSRGRAWAMLLLAVLLGVVWPDPPGPSIKINLELPKRAG